MSTKKKKKSTSNSGTAHLTPLYYFAAPESPESNVMNIKMFKLGGNINLTTRGSEVKVLSAKLPWGITAIFYGEKDKELFYDTVEVDIRTPIQATEFDFTEVVSKVRENYLANIPQDEVIYDMVMFVYPKIKKMDKVAMMQERRVQLDLTRHELETIIDTPFEEWIWEDGGDR